MNEMAAGEIWRNEEMKIEISNIQPEKPANENNGSRENESYYQYRMA